MPLSGRPKGISAERLQSPFASEGQSNDSHMTCKLLAHVRASSMIPVYDSVFGSNQQCNSVDFSYVEKTEDINPTMEQSNGTTLSRCVRLLIK